MESTTRTAELQRVLSYRNPRVLNKFRTQYSVSQEDAEEIFMEMKKWLWLCARRHEDESQGIRTAPGMLVIHTSMIIIDELWHTFILHTDDYVEFCKRYFGRFIHHSPGSADFEPLTERQVEEQLEYVCDQLGEETLVTWHEAFADRYSPDALRSLMRPPVFGRPCEAI